MIHKKNIPWSQLRASFKFKEHKDNILKMFENVQENVLKCPKIDLKHHKMF